MYLIICIVLLVLHIFGLSMLQSNAKFAIKQKNFKNLLKGIVFVLVMYSLLCKCDGLCLFKLVNQAHENYFSVSHEYNSNEFEH